MKRLCLVRIGLFLGLVLIFLLGGVAGVWLAPLFSAPPSQAEPHSPVIGVVKVGADSTLPVLAPTWRQADPLSTFPPGWIPLMTFRGKEGGRALTVPIAGLAAYGWKLQWSCALPPVPDLTTPLPPAPITSYHLTVFAYQTGGLVIDEPLKVMCPQGRPTMSEAYPGPCPSPVPQQAAPSPCSGSIYLEIRAEEPEWSITVLGFHPDPNGSA